MPVCCARRSQAIARYAAWQHRASKQAGATNGAVYRTRKSYDAEFSVNFSALKICWVDFNVWKKRLVIPIKKNYSRKHILSSHEYCKSLRRIYHKTFFPTTLCLLIQTRKMGQLLIRTNIPKCCNISSVPFINWFLLLYPFACITQSKKNKNQF